MERASDFSSIIIEITKCLHAQAWLRLNFPGQHGTNFSSPDDSNFFEVRGLRLEIQKMIPPSTHRHPQSRDAKKRQNKIHNNRPAGHHPVAQKIKPSPQLDDRCRSQGGEKIFGIGQAEKSQKASELAECGEKHQLQE
jgi:hypothetical protein